MSTNLDNHGFLKLPDMFFVQKHFADLLGRPVTVVKNPAKLKTGPTDKFFGAWYELDDHTICGAIAVDVPLGAIFGTSMALQPASIATNLAKTGNFDELTMEVLFEALNVSSRFFHRTFEKQVTILHVAAWNAKPPAHVFPPEARAILDKPAQRNDFTVTVNGYGAGTMAMACI